eukprot:TRINITY_DN18035_c0_g2_i1.p1 TRINITY_DN18035_c0_g2~~TRINITY_DN18035_c0_g2_i1.p1  ORF type:complete len:590 (+),score=69.88 TRINITY_DN18035_c0_g2_i1:205-1974(+)
MLLYVATVLAVWSSAAAARQVPLTPVQPVTPSMRRSMRHPVGDCEMVTAVAGSRQEPGATACKRSVQQAASASCECTQNISYTGDVGDRSPVSHPYECCQRCDATPSCAAAVFRPWPKVAGYCRLQYNNTNLIAQSNAVACVPDRRSYKCKFAKGHNVVSPGGGVDSVVPDQDTCCKLCFHEPYCAAAVWSPWPTNGSITWPPLTKPPGVRPAPHPHFPPHGGGGGDDFRRHVCDPHECYGSGVNTSKWYCAALPPIRSEPRCRAVESGGPPCLPGWLPCAGPGAKRGHMPNGWRCGCGWYRWGSSENDTVLCVNRPNPENQMDATCSLPDADGDCAVTDMRCAAQTIPRLLLEMSPKTWHRLLAAVSDATNSSIAALQVVSLCPSSACADGCPPTASLRFQHGCINNDANLSALAHAGPVVFDFDLDISDNVTRQDALAAFFDAVNAAVNGSTGNEPQGAAALRELGAQGAQLEPAPAQRTEAPTPSPAPPSGGGLPWLPYALAGGAGTLVVLVGVGRIAQRVRWGGGVNFQASRTNAKQGMAGCLRPHGGRRQPEVNVDCGSDDEWQPGSTQSRSTSSSDSEPEIDL